LSRFGYAETAVVTITLARPAPQALTRPVVAGTLMTAQPSALATATTGVGVTTANVTSIWSAQRETPQLK